MQIPILPDPKPGRLFERTQNDIDENLKMVWSWKKVIEKIPSNFLFLTCKNHAWLWPYKQINAILSKYKNNFVNYLKSI